MGKALKITKKIFSALLWVLLIFIIVSMAFLLIASRGGQVPFLNGVRSVSYTHLTLPTN